MWKRVQTLYIGIATIIIASMFFFRMATIIAPGGEEIDIMYYDKVAYIVMLIMLIAGGVASAFSYKNLFLQARVCMLTALMQIGFQIWLAVDFFRFHNDMVFSFSLIFPIVSAILNIMAARNILIDGMTVQAMQTSRKLKIKK